MDFAEGIDPVIGGGAGLLALVARMVAFPLATLRRRRPEDAPDAEPSGVPYIPKSLQKAVAMTATVAIGVAGGVLVGVPPVHAASAALSAAALSMAAYDLQMKREPRAARNQLATEVEPES